MFDTTLFHAKKILKKRDGGWDFDISLLFDGFEFSLTEYPIRVNGEDAKVLIPGLDQSAAKVGETYTDTIEISSEGQFGHVFRSALTDDATELLADVYAGRSWKLRIMDTHGDEFYCGSYLPEMFMDAVSEDVGRHSPCWIELSYAETSFREDWTLDFGEERIVFSNLHDGFAPMNLGEVMSVLGRFVPASRFSDKEEFRGTVTKQGNSLVLKVTDQCRRMGIEVGDEVDVTLSRRSAEENTMLRVFYARKWTPIDDPDSICDRDGCDLSIVRRFLDDFNVIGTVSPAGFSSTIMRPGEPSYLSEMDHMSFLKTASGENIIVSQPYRNGHSKETIEMWARTYGCTVEEHPEYSWHHPPETTLYVFRKASNQRWRLPRESDRSDSE